MRASYKCNISCIVYVDRKLSYKSCLLCCYAYALLAIFWLLWWNLNSENGEASFKQHQVKEDDKQHFTHADDSFKEKDVSIYSNINFVSQSRPHM
jgi:hypothetical protein